MPCTDHFRLADDLINHLGPIATGIADPFIKSRYAGFVSVAAVTVFELAIKEIFFTFGDAKHRVLGAFTRRYFDRINGRIKYKVVCDDYAQCFGDKYAARFKRHIANAERKYMKAHRKSILAAYNNVIEWRNSFAHNGVLPPYATYEEVVDAYKIGKELIHCLALSMRR